ncbi:MAG: peptidase C15 [Hormoscilla sp. GM7CHS1pb]|nr:peptidase C15 [Hormoscilla sp. GM7CHS1pb]
MTRKILLTSFDTWLPHHKSNASDDLLIEVAKLDDIPYELNLLRQLPVDIRAASDRVLAQIDQLQPDAIVCCGMAEGRTSLSLESNARRETVLKTPINLDKLLVGLDDVQISHDAGRFVCEGLYYSVLQAIAENNISSNCLFVHVPLLTPDNSVQMQSEVLQIIQRMGTMRSDRS